MSPAALGDLPARLLDRVEVRVTGPRMFGTFPVEISAYLAEGVKIPQLQELVEAVAGEKDIENISGLATRYRVQLENLRQRVLFWSIEPR